MTYPAWRAESSKRWKQFSLFLALPAIIGATINAWWVHQKEHGHPRAEFVPYDHLRMRNREYPWGGHKSLFHNADANALPDGYETEDKHGHH